MKKTAIILLFVSMFVMNGCFLSDKEDEKGKFSGKEATTEKESVVKQVKEEEKIKQNVEQVTMEAPIVKIASAEETAGVKTVSVPVAVKKTANLKPQFDVQQSAQQSEAKKVVDEYMIQHALYQFHDLNFDAQADVFLSDYNGDSARGTVRYGGVQNSGSEFYAYRDGYGWKVSYDGFGRAPCEELKQVVYPEEMVSNCFPRKDCCGCVF